MKIARLRNKGELELKNEIIEYPSELEGNRNLFASPEGELHIKEIIEYPPELDGCRNLTTFNNPSTWSNTKVVNKSNYCEIDCGTSTAAWGVVTDRNIGLNLLQGEQYTVSFEVKSDNLAVLRYNYVISSSGNMKVSNVIIDKPNEWTKFSITFTSSIDRINAGILLGGDLRSEASGTSFLIRNVKLERGGEASQWTPAPEDLGLSYSEDINSFGTKFFGGTLMASEVREIDTLITVELIDNDNLVGWSGGYTTDPSVPNVLYVSGTRGGLRINKSTFEVGEVYELTFKIKKTSGDILSIAGHAQSFEHMEVYLNEELLGSSWSGGLGNTYPNDNLEHSYRVILKFNDVAADGNLYIQPNRNDNYSTNYTAEIRDLSLRKRKPSWYQQ